MKKNCNKHDEFISVIPILHVSWGFFFELLTNDYKTKFEIK